MKTRHPPLLLAAVAASLLAGAAPALAQGSTATPGGQGNVTTRKAPQDARSQKDADKRWEATHRASKIIGSDVRNAKGDKVGTVKDLVLDDPASGRISRVVVSVGGVGGMGDKLFALPYSDLQRAPGKDALVLNNDSDLARAFDGNHWSALANDGADAQASARGATDSGSGTAASGEPSASSGPASTASAASGATSATPASGAASSPATPQ